MAEKKILSDLTVEGVASVQQTAPSADPVLMLNRVEVRIIEGHPDVDAIGIGTHALESLTATPGEYAGQSIAIGNNALMSLGPSATGNRNTAVGSAAGKSLASGDGNVFVGTGAARDVPSGNRNVFIGNVVGVKSLGLRGDTNDVVMVGENTGRLTAMTGVNAGKDWVKNSVAVGSSAKVDNEATAVGVLSAAGNEGIAIGAGARAVGASIAIGVDFAGATGGTNAGDATTTAAGEVRILGKNRACSAFRVGTGTVAVTGSSVRYKEDIKPLDLSEAQGLLSTIEAKSFRYKAGDAAPSGDLAGKENLGFIAEDVKDAGMFVREYDGVVEDISERNLIAVLWKVVQDQQARIEALEART